MHARVLSRTDLTPHLVRVVLGGDGLTGLQMPDATDAYVNLALPPAGAPYGAVFDPQQVRDEHPRETWPARRRYTVRRWDAVVGELTIDFVVHCDKGPESGVAGPWARNAREGDVLVFEGPSGDFRPRHDADWHLMVGDESALPAIAASMEVVPEGAPLTVVLLCDGPDDEVALETSAELELHWLHRDGSGTELVSAIERLDFRSSDVCAFVHGEADEIRAIRRHLLTERGLRRAEMSCSPYWRRTMTDEAWRAVKKQYVAQMEAELEAELETDA